MTDARSIDIVGVPSDLGANRRGANMGPAAVRIAGLKKKIERQGYTVEDLGDLEVSIRDTLNQTVVDNKFLEPLTELCRSLCETTHNSLAGGRMPVIVGGDHSIAIGTISGVAKFFKDRNEGLGLVWIDAHADINTPETSPSGNIHGMPLATLIGNGHPALCAIGGRHPKVKAENVALIGVRSIDQHEKQMLRESGINCYSMQDVDSRGMSDVMEEVIDKVSYNTGGIHVSFDIDGIDPHYAPGVSTPVGGGLTVRESHLLLEMLHKTQKISSLEFVELNPYTDAGAKSAHLVVELILSALGKSIT